MELETPFPSDTAFAIEYPGYVASVDKVIKTLGGLGTLSGAREHKSQLIELRYRPDDPLSHPLYADIRKTPSNLLLKISSRKRKKMTSSRDGDHDNAKDLKLEVVARVGCVYQFKGMADFQYTAQGSFETRAQMQDQKDNHWRSFTEGKASQLERDAARSDEPMLILPPLFSKFDMPQDYKFQGFHAVPPKTRPPLDPKGERALSAAPVHPVWKALPVAEIPFNSPEVPQARPLPEQTQPNFKKAQALLTKMFEERPIWSVHALAAAVAPEMMYYLRRLLHWQAYKFHKGPWRLLLIRRGVDPRASSALRHLQLVYWRQPQQWYLKSIGELRERKDTKDSEGGAADATEGGSEKGALSEISEQRRAFLAVHSFQELPKKQSAVFQLIDIQDPTIQAIVENAEVPNTCNETTGWFRRRTMRRITNVLFTNFQPLAPADVSGVARPMRVDRPYRRNVSIGGEKKSDQDSESRRATSVSHLTTITPDLALPDHSCGTNAASTTGTVSAAHDDGTKSRTKIDEAIKGGYQFHKDDTEHLKQLADDPFDKLDARQTLLEGPRLDTHSAPEKSEQTSSPPSGQLPGGLKLHSQSLGDEDLHRILEETTAEYMVGTHGNLGDLGSDDEDVYQIYRELEDTSSDDNV